MNKPNETIEIRWSTWWMWGIFGLAVVITLLGLASFFRHIGMAVGLTLGGAAVAGVCFYFIKNPPLTGRLTATHLEVGNLAVPWNYVVEAGLYETRIGGANFHVGIRLTDEGREVHGKSLLADVTGYDHSIDSNHISGDIHGLIEEINRRAGSGG